MVLGQEVALRSAYACAALGKAQPAVGWLENISQITSRKDFDPIRQSEYFQKFLKHHPQE